MTVREAALEAIRLAEQRNAEEHGIDEQLGLAVGYEWGADKALKSRLASRPAERALIDYLGSLPPDVLFKLRTLMYFGRGDSEDISWLHAHLGSDPADIDAAVSSMVGKSPLPRYLQRGLEEAERASVDLDGVWPEPPDQSSPVETNALKNPQPADRTFPPGRHPIGDGGTIFKEIAAEWTGDVIQGPADVSKFFDTLQDRTAGQVILDFIDMANWDQIEGHAFDAATGDLELYWHGFRRVDAEGARFELETAFFPASLYGLLIRIQEIRIVRGQAAAAFLLSGHTLDHKEIKSRLAHDADEHKAIQDRFFSSRLVRRIGEQIHVFDVLASPLYTAAILPKAMGIPTSASRSLLFTANLERVRASLQRAATALQRVSPDDVDTICEKTNTIRRNWEQALKIEVVYRDLRPNDSYSNLLLGELIKLLKDVHSSTTSTPLGRIIGWANELSHDAGRAIEVHKAQEITAHVSAYVDSLRKQIRLAPFPSRS
jgi:hypothetical protein